MAGHTLWASHFEKSHLQSDSCDVTVRLVYFRSLPVSIHTCGAQVSQPLTVAVNNIFLMCTKNLKVCRS